MGGFITPEDGGGDCFVHRTNLVDGGSLVEGSEVTYEQSWDAKKNKPIATNVRGAVGEVGKRPPPADNSYSSGSNDRGSPYGLAGAAAGGTQTGTVSHWN